MFSYGTSNINYDTPASLENFTCPVQQTEMTVTTSAPVITKGWLKIPSKSSAEPLTKMIQVRESEEVGDDVVSTQISKRFTIKPCYCSVTD